MGADLPNLIAGIAEKAKSARAFAAAAQRRGEAMRADFEARQSRAETSLAELRGRLLRRSTGRDGKAEP